MGRGRGEVGEEGRLREGGREGGREGEREGEGEHRFSNLLSHLLAFAFSSSGDGSRSSLACFLAMDDHLPELSFTRFSWIAGTYTE